jgi:hypothetical protein
MTNKNTSNNLEEKVSPNTEEGIGIGTIPRTYTGNIKEDLATSALYLGLFTAGCAGAYLGYEVIGVDLSSKPMGIIRDYPTTIDYLINNTRNIVGFVVGGFSGLTAVNSLIPTIMSPIILGVDLVSLGINKLRK